MKQRHAICLECGSVLHVPVTFASSRKAEREMGPVVWVKRLAAGCADCGGQLSSVKLDGCTDCEAFLKGAA